MAREAKKKEHESNSPWKPTRREDLEPKIRNLIKGFIKEIPSLPAHAHKLLDVVSSKESDLLEVAKVASSDPAVVTNIFKAVNSSYYGLSHRTNNLNFAIVLLGFNEVRKIAIQTNFSHALGKSWTYKGYTTRDLWEHSYMVSVCAETFGDSKDPRYSGELLTFGLLHDIGKYVLFKLAMAMQKKGIAPYKSAQASESSNILEREEAIFNINHTIVGSMLAERWNLSEKICSILEYHHYPSYWSIEAIPPEYLKDTAIICFSDLIVRRLTGEEKIPEPSKEYYKMFNAAPSSDNLITDERRIKIEEARKYIDFIQ
ncbi:MAG: HDOD domain-containing protein [Candidatus Latescibacteria bacterium]|jgi:two-component system, cell cycle response regulator|nr:HDOD domain-containing protein [Candidatus Latescibacterota bacterium]